MDSKFLSVIISNRNDTAMLSVTVNSCIEELRPLGLRNCEIIICDNSDLSIYKTLSSYLPVGYIREHLLKVIRQDYPCLFSAREKAIELSTGKYISCIDSHIISGRDMFLDMVKFMESREGDKTLGFAHAPINWSHHHQSYSKHDRDMSKHELGDWNKRYNKPRTITWKGMPWICRRSLWSAIRGYGALSEHNVSWGGGDMHIGIKPWLLGYKNWAVPTNAAIHIGPFPTRAAKQRQESAQANGDGYQYRLYGNSGEYPHTFGFLVSCYILGGEKMMTRNKAALTERFGKYIDPDKWWHKAMEIGAEEKQWLDANKKLSFEQLLETRPWDTQS
jgi:hypothetical protein